MVASMKMAVIKGVVPCSQVEVYRCLRGTCYLHHQSPSSIILTMEAASTSERSVTPTRLHGTTTEKTAIFRISMGLKHLLKLQVQINCPQFCVR
jgi:hypothetical protein